MDKVYVKIVTTICKGDMEMEMQMQFSRLEELLKKEAMLTIITNYISRVEYINKEELLILLCIDDEQGEE